MDSIVEVIKNWWLTVLFILVFSVCLHRLVFWFSKRFIKEKSLWKSILKKVELPTLFLFVFIGLFGLIDFSTLSEPNCQRALFTTEFFLILFAAWSVLRFFDGALEGQIEQLKEKNDRTKRANITQMSFAYKLFSLFVIFFIIGSIFLISPGLKTLGIGLLGSAGIAGIAIGLAAQPLLLNLIAGFQLVVNKTLNIGDVVFIKDDSCIVEEIRTTQVILRSWDGRRHIFPISTFVNESYQNWDLKDASKIGRVSIFCDFSAPIQEIRSKFEQYIRTEPLHNGKIASLFVMDTSVNAIEVVCECSANSPSELFQLKNKIREEIVTFIQANYPKAFPQMRYYQEK